MGGNALKHLGVQRVNANTYNQLVERVCLMFSREFNQRPVPVISYATKPDFGDADLLVVGQQLPQDWREIFEALMNSRGWVRNGEVTSMEIEQVQFDFINCPASHLHWANTYFAYNDLGNLMGRVAHKMRFKYGHQGLLYLLRDDNQDHVLAEIDVGAEPADVFDFLGYDYRRWSTGFDTLQDIFEFAASSPWFHPDIYLLHNRNHVSRIRDAKRKTYTEFLQWCEANRQRLNRYDWEADVSAQRKYHFERAVKRWPAFNQAILAAQQRAAEQRELRKTWNGENVMAWTGLSGRELGEFMTKTRQHPDFAVAAQNLSSLEGFVRQLAGQKNG